MGRDEECGVIREVLDAARTGLSGVLVIRGEAGIGKSTLLDYAAEAAPDFLVVRLVGVETEQGLSFAALHRLLMPILHQIERLPPPQRDALNIALGFASGPPANPFMLGLGVMTLAATAARARERLLVTIDDAQWIDRESMTALAFWARRLHAEGTAVIFGERRDAAVTSPLQDFRVIDVGGLDGLAARSLLQASAGRQLDRDAADRLLAETGGNPLALAEFARNLSADRPITITSEMQPLPVSRRVEQRFATRVRALPAKTQMLLLLVAAESSGDPATLWAAAEQLGVTRDAADPAEADGLLVLDTGVRIPHPLIRSAVYAGARAVDRRAVHAALASTTDAIRDPERRVWHLAAASMDTDESVAAELEACARRSSDRGAHSAAASLLVRAAEMTVDPARAAEDRLLAAEASLTAGAVMQAQLLLAEVMPSLVDRKLVARAKRVQGHTWAYAGRSALAAPLLFAASTELEALGHISARSTLWEAMEQALFAGELSQNDRVVRHTIAQSVLEGPPRGDSLVELALRAAATYISVGFVAAAGDLRRILTAMRSLEVDPTELARFAIPASNAARALWDPSTEADLMRRIARGSREQGALRRVNVALQAAASALISLGEFAEAANLLAEAFEVTRSTGRNELASIDLELAAHQGRDLDARSVAATSKSLWRSLGLGLMVDSADMSLVILDVGLGRYDEALELAQGIFDRDLIPFGNTVLPNYVEAAARAGDLDAARGGLARLADRAVASGSSLALGLLARSRAVLNSDAEPDFQQAIVLLEQSRSTFEVARARLLYGEWLRRERRRTDAREQLRDAFEAFSTMGANAFAERAHAELLATGEHARRRSIETVSNLTPQEAKVARLAADGETNLEIASQLFLSVSTVEYHLRKVFRKLDITSRRELKAAVSAHVSAAPS